MILPGGRYRVYLATRPVDFRKGHAGLSLIVQSVLGHDPFGGAVFVFRSKRGDQMKCLVWEFAPVRRRRRTVRGTVRGKNGRSPAVWF